MCGFYLQDKIEKWNDFYFEKGEDYFENSFIATKKNNPLVEKWHFILRKY